jgi:hypothetical protein
VEETLLAARTAADWISVRQGRGEPWEDLLAPYRLARERLITSLTGVDSLSMDSSGQALLRTIRETAASRLGAEPAPVVAVGSPEHDTASCRYDPAALLVAAGSAGLSARILLCYSASAGRIPYGGGDLDRLTVLARLGTTDDRAERARLFQALQPVWRSVNGDGSPGSPWRTLLAARAREWSRTGLPHVDRARGLRIPSDSVERWLEAVLAAWRAAQPDSTVEPWDWYHYVGAAARGLGARIPQEQLLPVSRSWYRKLGADPGALGVQYDIEPRPGKYPVAYTTFGARPFRSQGDWDPGSPYVSAAYRIGGLDNLVELLHETGHAIHIAGIRTRPAYADWPDSDTFTEALADLASQDAYEPRWQVLAVGDSVPLAQGIRGKYGAVVLDVAWALFEIRMFRDPTLDPNRVWAEITSRFLRIRPHPEWSWWAMRGQLIESPGYLLNYALGGILTAALRARIRELRGDWLAGDPGWYPWVRERLFRFGASRPAADVVQEFLGRPLTPEALLADLARGKGSRR